MELLVVMSLIGILATFTINTFSGAQAKSRDTRRKSDLKQLQTALELYYSDFGSYPRPSTLGCGVDEAFSSEICWSGLLSSFYMKAIPTDPKNIDLGSCGTTPGCYVYHYCWLGSGQEFVLAANLENPADPDIKVNNSNCPMGGPSRYWITNP